VKNAHFQVISSLKIAIIVHSNLWSSQVFQDLESVMALSQNGTCRVSGMERTMPIRTPWVAVRDELNTAVVLSVRKNIRNEII